MIFRSLFIFILLIPFLVTHLRAKDTIYIVKEAWHTGIIIKTSSISSTIFPDIKSYDRFPYIDIGWGDEKYFQAEGAPIGLAARAILFPTSAVIQVFGLKWPVDEFYERSEQIVIDSATFQALCHFIADSFKRNDEGNIMASSAKEPTHAYYKARRKYHLFRTCNTWVALALKEAGFNVRSFLVLTSGQLFRQLKGLQDHTSAEVSGS